VSRSSMRRRPGCNRPGPARRSGDESSPWLAKHHLHPAPPGRYAVIAFHDENDNGRLDESPWGVPTEGYGFSNDAQGFLAAPSFEAAGVMLDAGDSAVTISLIYPKTAQGPAPAQGLR
jgi:hypothetical protein